MACVCVCVCVVCVCVRVCVCVVVVCVSGLIVRLQVHRLGLFPQSLLSSQLSAFWVARPIGGRYVWERRYRNIVCESQGTAKSMSRVKIDFSSNSKNRQKSLFRILTSFWMNYTFIKVKNTSSLFLAQKTEFNYSGFFLHWVISYHSDFYFWILSLHPIIQFRCFHGIKMYLTILIFSNYFCFQDSELYY